MRPAGERLVGGRAVVEVVVRDAPHDRVAVGQPGQAGHVLAEAGARYRRGGGRELTAGLAGSVGLWGPQLQLALGPLGVDGGDRPRPAPPPPPPPPPAPP